MAEKRFQGQIRTEYCNSAPWWEERLTAPKNAPNVLYILLDDTGFADMGCYGALIETPNIDALAADGLRYRNFHVNPMCSPTRASLLSGCNHHAVGMGYLANYDLGFPGYRGCVDKEHGLISETLCQNGYNTFMVGKWHLMNDDISTPAGPFDQWPTGRGFNKYYGFLGPATSQYHPQLVCGNEFVDQPKSAAEGYHLSEDLVDRAIQYIGDTKSYQPDKPFFGYVAFGAAHSPHQVPKEYVDMYKGRFDFGWHEYRRRVFARQKALGIVPENAKLCGDDRYVAEWEAYSPQEQKRLAKYMEVYAGFITHTDAQIGRLVDYLKTIGEYDNTLIVFLTDNGASAGGGREGTANTLIHFDVEKGPEYFAEEAVDALGGEDSSPHYPVAWAHASNTPMQLYKSWSHNGGIKVPLILCYPNGIKDKGGIRSQYHHVTDINETVLELCGLDDPETVNGVAQARKDGISMAYTFDDPAAPGRRHVQYYEMLGNRGIWSDGWKAVADHVANPSFSFENDAWELYHTDEDFSETENLADKYPEKLRELIELWFHEAGKNQVLPLLESHMKQTVGYNNRSLLHFRPQKDIPCRTLYPQMTGTGELTLRGSFELRVFADYKPGDEGVLLSMGDNMGGYALYIRDGRFHFHYNFLAYRHFTARSEGEISAGDHVFALRFTETGKGEGLAQVLIDGELRGQTVIVANQLFSSHFGGFRLGRFSNVSVTGSMKEKGVFPYSGHIRKAEADFNREISDLDRMKQMAAELRRE